jgi:hypothetical protein
MRTSGPEKIVESEIRAWGARNGFDLTVVDTSAVWNPKACRYISRQASESLPDLIGNHGPLSVWIELKAPGARSSINSGKSLHQREFLVRKIKQGCFAVVTDGVSHMDMIWLKYRRAELFDKAAILINDLPVTRITRLSAPRDIALKKQR